MFTGIFSKVVFFIVKLYNIIPGLRGVSGPVYWSGFDVHVKLFTFQRGNVCRASKQDQGAGFWPLTWCLCCYFHSFSNRRCRLRRNFRCCSSTFPSRTLPGTRRIGLCTHRGGNRSRTFQSLIHATRKGGKKRQKLHKLDS